MATQFSNRFLLIIDQIAGGNKKRFAELTGKSASHIYKICRGASRPSMQFLEHIYDEFRIDLNWLLTGEQSEALAQPNHSTQQDLVYAPMYDVQASAGIGTDVANEDINDYFAFNKQWLSNQLRVSSDRLAFVSISGDSMYPTLHHGDDVLVNLAQQHLVRDGIYLLHTNEGLIAKRLAQKSDGDFRIISDNPDYPERTVSANDEENIRIIGNVVWCARTVK